MPQRDIPEPFTGLARWSPLVGAACALFLAIPAMYLVDHNPNVFLFVPVILLALLAYELFLRLRTTRRRYTFTHGLPLQATITAKRETSRSTSILRARYTLNDRPIESEQTVSPETYARTPLHPPLHIRVHPPHPHLWLPA